MGDAAGKSPECTIDLTSSRCISATKGCPVSSARAVSRRVLTKVPETQTSLVSKMNFKFYIRTAAVTITGRQICIV